MSILFRLFVFLLPTQLGYHFWPEWSYIFGIRVDYLSPTIFLTDALLAFIFLLFALKFIREKTRIPKGFVLGCAGVLVLAIANIAGSLSLTTSAIRWLKILELLLLAFLVAKVKEFNFKSWVVKPLALSVIFFSAVGVAQVVMGRTIGGLMYFLGERSFSVNTPGIATLNIFGRDFLRAYSTFSHPNSLAGFLAVSLLLIALFYPKKESKLIKSLALLGGGLCLLLTFSLAAVGTMTVVLGLIILYRRRSLIKVSVRSLFWAAVILSLILPLVSSYGSTRFKQSNESVVRRLSLSEVAGKMIAEKPLFGVGANNFVVALPNKSLYPAVSWWLQPVHNIYLLVFSETGVVGLLIFAYLFFAALSGNLNSKNNLVFPLLFIVLTGSLDHYWLTLNQNQLLMSLVLGLSFRRDKV